MRSNNDLLCFLGASMLLASCVGASTVRAQTQTPNAVPTIRFYEGFDAKEKNICTISIETVPYYSHKSMKEMDCANDEAKSMKLHDLTPGSVIELYDDPGCGDHDDWVRITVIKGRPGANDLIVGGFQGTGTWTGGGTDPNSYRSEFHEKSRYALHGKVSCAIISVKAPHPAK